MRIIAGRFRGQTIKAPRGSETRPTADRVREALFSILGDLNGLTIVDCFAGSGAMGLEALSRGARRVVMIESARGAIGTIRENVAKLGTQESVSIAACAVEASRRHLEREAPFDVVIADPPWPSAEQSAERLVTTVRGLLSPQARVVIGHRRSEPIELPDGSALVLTDRRHWGDSGMSFYSVLLDS